MQLQTEYEKIVLEKLKQLPPMYWKEVIDFIEFLKLKIQKNKTLFLSEKNLLIRALNVRHQALRGQAPGLSPLDQVCCIFYAPINIRWVLT